MSAAKNWVFTLNNYTDEDVDRLKNSGAPLVYAVIGREVGESNTPHLQGMCCFSIRKRFAFVKGFIGANAHIEICRNVNHSETYCKKEGNFFIVGAKPVSNQGQRSDMDAFKDDVKAGNISVVSVREIHSDLYARCPQFCLEYINDHMPKRSVPCYPLRPWQQELNQILNLPPHPREIIFVVDLVGNMGKTWFAHYYSSIHDNNVQVLLPGKKADMVYALECTSRVLFIDAPRSKQGEYLQYDFLEEVKNGYIFNSKYRSFVKSLEDIHVVVLMNECPDMTKLSQDRYKVINL